MVPQNLGELLSLSAKIHPHRIALVFGQKKISYKSLDDLTNRIAVGLIRLGVKPLDRVAVFLDNCPEFVYSYFAVLKAGATVVPINYMFKIEEAKFILQDSQASYLITSRTYVDMAEELKLRLDHLRQVITTSKIRDGLADFHSLVKDTDAGILQGISSFQGPAVILYTSGTTGFPKGAILSHSNLISNAIDCSCAIKVNHKNTFICILPLFHSFAATVCMNLPLLVGAKIILMKSVRPFKRIIRAIRKNRVDVFVGVPSIYNILANIKLPKVLNSPLIRLFNPLKVCVSGAAALPAETFRAFERKFRIPLLEGYGLTEASPVVTINPLKDKRMPGSIGKVLTKNIDVKIVDVNGNEVASGQIGELLVKGPNVMQGYFRQPEATFLALRDNWLYTGDMARIDQNGYLYISGRLKEMINVRGLNVYPREIEDVLYQNPKVKEAAVIGLPDKHKGEVPKGFVVLKENSAATEQEIIQYLRDRLASFKIPKWIEFRSSLPKNTTGKILKRLLKDE
ncbi:MAG: long-chain fatty acid--CoA ligase [Candidatus Omnitrophica bacterium]|nr:long-chain fatty acid--CoA ligase [Candidatus Omnitrophota bacterium]